MSYHTSCARMRSPDEHQTESQYVPVPMLLAFQLLHLECQWDCHEMHLPLPAVVDQAPASYAARHLQPSVHPVQPRERTMPNHLLAQIAQACASTCLRDSTSA